jgi:RNA polymerase sigma factor (sigma-70 family)
MPDAPAPAVEVGRDTIVDIWQHEHLALFRFARAATGDDEAAEDVLQESFVRLIREVAAGRAPDNAHGWLFRVATNLVVSQVRRARTAERHLVDLERDPLAASPEQLVLLTERDAEVRLALDDLPTDGRVALLLAARGFSGREIAHTLGRSEGAVRTLLCRSRLRVRERLDAERTRVEDAAG